MTAQTQPEALVLAQFLLNMQTHLGSSRDSCGDEWDQAAWDNYDKAVAMLRSLHAEVEQLRAAMKIPTIEKGSKDWLSSDPAIAWHQIDRYADNWADIGQMMQEYVDAQKQSAVERLEARIADLERQLAARAPLSDEQLGALQAARNLAMRHAAAARIPECGEFGKIAQDLDAVLMAIKGDPA